VRLETILCNLRNALIVTRRELRDNLTDWRVVTPILVLTLGFPWLMDITAKIALDFTARYGQPIVAERLIPFLLMVVGFFPISFSLVIALETFVGEKERGSLEPLLATPLSDRELYLGKLMASLLLPLAASYLGICFYLIGLYWTLGYTPPPLLLAQVLILTATEALVMVSGAVVVSSQATSMRAANLLASFIIIPMALLIQGESVAMFWGRYGALWFVALGLVVADVLLIRMGLHLFNREELLARQMDRLDWKGAWRNFRRFLLGHSSPHSGLPIPLRWYRHDIPTLLPRQRIPLLMATLAALGGLLLGWAYAARYPLPEGGIELKPIPQQAFQDLSRYNLLPPFTVRGIFLHNVRALLIGALLSLFSFGVFGLLLMMVPLVIIGFFAGEAYFLGYNPWLFLAAFVLPHGWAELPAALISTAFAVRMGASLISPPSGRSLGNALIQALAEFVKVFLMVVVPLLLLAAFLEVHITPQVVAWFYG